MHRFLNARGLHARGGLWVLLLPASLLLSPLPGLCQDAAIDDSRLATAICEAERVTLGLSPHDYYDCAVQADDKGKKSRAFACYMLAFSGLADGHPLRPHACSGADRHRDAATEEYGYLARLQDPSYAYGSLPEEKERRAKTGGDSKPRESAASKGRPPAPGKISVKTNPNKATLYLDGRATPARSPTTLSGVEPGEREVVAVLGNKVGQTRIKVKSRATASTKVNLNKSYGEINLDVQPKAAKVSLGGVERGAAGSVRLQAEPGSHKLVLSAPGHCPYEETVYVSEGAIQVVAELKRCGRVKIAVDPPGAEVLIDGKSLGKGSVDTMLPLGEHRVQVKMADHIPQQKTVWVFPQGEEMEVSLVSRSDLLKAEKEGFQQRQRFWNAGIWTTAGLAGAGAVGTGILIAVNRSESAAADDKYKQYLLAGNQAEADALKKEVKGHEKTADQSAMGAWIAGGIAVGMAGTALILLLTRPEWEEGGGAVWITPLPMAGGGAALLEASF